MTFLLNLITAAVLYGTPLLYGTSGEILTEKSGNLNLGVEGMMFMGGALGLGAAFYYEKLAGAAVSAPLAVVIAIAASFLAGALAALLFSFLTITLRANQNVTGLALTIFGTGVGQYIGEFMRVREGTYVAVSNTLKGAFNGSPFPVFLQELPVVGRLLFSHSIFTYLGIAMAVAMGLYLHRSRSGLYLRAVGESPATADAAGISVTRCKYLATVIGGGISAIGGMVYIMTVVGGVWNHEGLSGVGWLAVALVIFCLWSPYRAIWGSILFGGLLILYLRMPIDLIPDQIYKILPYVVTVIVLVFTSMRNNRDKQPPASFAPGFKAHNSCVGRDARFYASVFPNGFYWINQYKGIKQVTFFTGGSSSYLESGDCVKVGYMWRRPLDPALNTESGSWGTVFWPYFRLAEIYLDYAEACNEKPERNETEALKYINLVRERSGLNALETAYVM